MTLRAILEAEAGMGLVGSRLLLAAAQERPGVPGGTARFPAMRPGQCYANAFELALRHPDLTYCEGRALSCGIVPIAHAWCVDAEGLVIDPTWDGAETSYFGIDFSTAWLHRWIESRPTYGVFSEMFPQDLLEHDPAEMLAAPDPARVTAVRAIFSETRAMFADRRRA